MIEKLIELLYEAEEKCEYTDCGQCEHIGLDACGFRMIADHLIANGVTLDNQVASSKWISVKDRLPIPYEKVLTCRRELLTGMKIICNEYLTIYHGETTMWSCDYETWKSEITHWMPLPDAPKGE